MSILALTRPILNLKHLTSHNNNSKDLNVCSLIWQTLQVTDKRESTNSIHLELTHFYTRKLGTQQLSLLYTYTTAVTFVWKSKKVYKNYHSYWWQVTKFTGYLRKSENLIVHYTAHNWNVNLCTSIELLNFFFLNPLINLSYI